MRGSGREGGREERKESGRRIREGMELGLDGEEAIFSGSRKKEERRKVDCK